MSRPPAWRRGAACVVACVSLAAWGAPTWGQEAETAEGKVEATLDAGSDRRIERRLTATFESLESLAGVRVAVSTGVVKLTGEVMSSDASELAGALARQIEGVTAVDNEIVESHSLQQRMSLVAEEIEDRAWDALRFLPLLAVALAVLALFVLAARLIGRAERAFGWLTRNVFLQDLARQAAQGAVFVLGLLLALEIMDATAVVGAVLGAAGLVGLAIGFAFRDLVENYIASILLSLRQPFAPNDHVIIEGHEGKVVRLTSRATILLSFDGNHIRLPNAMVFKAAIVNYSRKPERRFEFVVGLGVDENLAAAQDLAVSVLEGMEGVIDVPPPFVLVEALGDSNVALRLYGWVDQTRSDFGRVRSEAVRLVKNAFDAEGFEMPEPTYQVRIGPIGDAAQPRSGPDISSSEETRETRDVGRDHHLDQEIEAERAAEEPDLLNAASPVE